MRWLLLLALLLSPSLVHAQANVGRCTCTPNGVNVPHCGTGGVCTTGYCEFGTVPQTACATNSQCGSGQTCARGCDPLLQDTDAPGYPLKLPTPGQCNVTPVLNQATRAIALNACFPAVRSGLCGLDLVSDTNTTKLPLSKETDDDVNADRCKLSGGPAANPRWDICPSGGGGAPTNATYLTASCNTPLTAEQALFTGANSGLLFTPSAGTAGGCSFASLRIPGLPTVDGYVLTANSSTATGIDWVPGGGGGGGGWTDDGTVVRLTAPTDNVGIGTTSPDSKLDVEGGTPGIRLTGTEALARAFVMEETAGSYQIRDSANPYPDFKMHYNGPKFLFGALGNPFFPGYQGACLAGVGKLCAGYTTAFGGGNSPRFSTNVLDNDTYPSVSLDFAACSPWNPGSAACQPVFMTGLTDYRVPSQPGTYLAAAIGGMTPGAMLTVRKGFMSITNPVAPPTVSLVTDTACKLRVATYYLRFAYEDTTGGDKGMTTASPPSAAIDLTSGHCTATGTVCTSNVTQCTGNVNGTGVGGNCAVDAECPAGRFCCIGDTFTFNFCGPNPVAGKCHEFCNAEKRIDMSIQGTCSSDARIACTTDTPCIAHCSNDITVACTPPSTATCPTTSPSVCLVAGTCTNSFDADTNSIRMYVGNAPDGVFLREALVTPTASCPGNTCGPYQYCNANSHGGLEEHDVPMMRNTTTFESVALYLPSAICASGVNQGQMCFIDANCPASFCGYQGPVAHPALLLRVPDQALPLMSFRTPVDFVAGEFDGFGNYSLYGTPGVDPKPMLSLSTVFGGGVVALRGASTDTVPTIQLSSPFGNGGIIFSNGGATIPRGRLYWADPGFLIFDNNSQTEVDATNPGPIKFIVGAFNSKASNGMGFYGYTGAATVLGTQVFDGNTFAFDKPLAVANLAGGGTQCLQASAAGLITGTNAPCGSGGGGTAVACDGTGGNGCDTAFQIMMDMPSTPTIGLGATAGSCVPATTYYYRFAACSGFKGDNINGLGNCYGQTPPTPEISKATGASTSLTIAFPNHDGVAGWVVYRSTTPGGPYKRHVVGTFKYDTLTYNDKCTSTGNITPPTTNTATVARIAGNNPSLLGGANASLSIGCPFVETHLNVCEEAAGGHALFAQTNGNIDINYARDNGDAWYEPIAPSSGDLITGHYFRAFDGDAAHKDTRLDWPIAAAITAYVDGTPTTGNVPGKICLGVGTSSSGSSASETTCIDNTALLTHMGRMIATSYEFGNTRVIKNGNGTPEGVVTAPVGSLFLRSDGAVGTTLYTKETGSSNTGWAPVGGGGGDSIEVAGGNPVNDANFNEATPAALAGFVNVSWNFDGLTPTNVSASVPFASTIPLRAGAVSTENQTFFGSKSFQKSSAGGSGLCLRELGVGNVDELCFRVPDVLASGASLTWDVPTLVPATCSALGNGGKLTISSDGSIQCVADAGAALFNVKTYGALGNGVADDTAEIQAASTAAAGVGIVYFPAGTYKITSCLELDYNGAHWMGDGIASVIRQFTTAADGICNGTVGRLFSILLEDMTIDCNAAATSCGIGLNLEGVSDSTFRNVTVNVYPSGSAGFTTGVKVYSNGANQATRNLFYGLYARAFANAASIGVLLTGTSQSNGANSTRIFGGNIRADSGIGLSIPVGDQIYVTGITFEGTTNQAVKIQGDGSTSEGHVVTGCRFEGVTNGILLDTTSHGNTVFANVYSSGLTTKVTDSGGRNFVMEATATGGNAIALTTGSFQTTGGKFISITGDNTFQARTSASDTLGQWWAKPSRMGFSNGTTADISLLRSAAGVMQLETGAFAMNNNLYIGASTTTPRITSGSGTPEGVVTAATGSLYVSTGGGASTTLYVKASGSGNTGWVAK